MSEESNTRVPRVVKDQRANGFLWIMRAFALLGIIIITYWFFTEVLI